jgi:hypothetical protein
MIREVKTRKKCFGMIKPDRASKITKGPVAIRLCSQKKKDAACSCIIRAVQALGIKSLAGSK